MMEVKSAEVRSIVSVRALLCRVAVVCRQTLFCPGSTRYFSGSVLYFVTAAFLLSIHSVSAKTRIKMVFCLNDVLFYDVTLIFRKMLVCNFEWLTNFKL